MIRRMKHPAISLYQLFRYEVQVARFLIRDSRSTFFWFTVLGRVHPHLALTKWAPELGFCAPFDDMKLGTAWHSLALVGWKGESWRKLGWVGLSCRFSLIDPPQKKKTFPMMFQEYVSLCFPYNFSRFPRFPSMTACQKTFHWTSASMEFLGPYSHGRFPFQSSKGDHGTMGIGHHWSTPWHAVAPPRNHEGVQELAKVNSVSNVVARVVARSKGVPLPVSSKAWWGFPGNPTWLEHPHQKNGDRIFMVFFEKSIMFMLFLMDETI